MFGKLGFNIRSILAVIILVGSFTILGTMLFHEIPDRNKDVVNICIGIVLGASMGAVTGYYFGDSKKDTTIHKQ